MRINKILLIVLIILIASIFIGCVNRTSNYVSYSIYVWPHENSETTLIVPLAIDNKSDNIDQVMLVNPRFPKGSAFSEIINSEKGAALKIVIYEETVVEFSKYYNESGAELMENKTLSMTNTTYDEKGRPIMKSWVYVNSDTNKTSRFVISFHAGDSDKVRVLRIGERNVTNGWHQFTVEESYMVS